MLRDLATAFPAGWGGVIAASEINDNTGISLALFVAGVAFSFGFAWWARGERDRDKGNVQALQTKVESLQAEINGLYIDIKALSAKQEERQ